VKILVTMLVSRQKVIALKASCTRIPATIALLVPKAGIGLLYHPIASNSVKSVDIPKLLALHLASEYMRF